LFLRGGLIIEATRTDLLVNKVVLIVPQNSALGITSFEDAATLAATFAVGDPASVPVGQYTEEVYTFLGLWDAVSSKATLDPEVRTVLSHIASGDADAGVVYATDAATEPTVTVIAEAPTGSHAPVVYPAGVLAGSASPEQAAEFLTFLKSAEAATLFEASGFALAN